MELDNPNSQETKSFPLLIRTDIRIPDNFNHLCGIAPRNVARARHADDACYGLCISPTDVDFIAGLYHVRGFCRLSVQQNAARVELLLGHRATREKPTEF